MSDLTKFLVGIYDDEDEVLHAVTDVKSKGVVIQDVYTPFPIHGLDKAVGHPRTRIPIASFLFGITGTTLGTLFIVWTMGYDWPMIIGGKDHVAFPDFIPIIFECTVLLAAYGMVFTFCASNSLWPGKKPILFDNRTTDDKFVMAIDMRNNKLSEGEITSILKNSGAIEVNTKEVKWG
jgi:hypothetical protein